MDKLEFLDGAEAPNAETQPVETPEVTPEANAEAAPAQEPEAIAEKPTQPRGPDGKFAKKDDEPVMVPLAALHETRDKVRDLEARLAATQSQPEQVPDVFENPEGYTAYIQHQIAQTALNDRLNLSEEMVRQSAGDETVNAAQEWGKQQFAANPALAQQFYQQRNPYGFLVQQYQRQQALASLGDDPKEVEAFKAWKAAQAQLQQQPAQAVPQAQAEAPPASIASAPSAGGLQTAAIGPGVAFANVIK